MLLERYYKCYYISITGDFSDLLMNYVNQFGSKQCCYTDINSYMYVMDKEQRMQVVFNKQCYVYHQNGQLTLS